MTWRDTLYSIAIHYDDGEVEFIDDIPNLEQAEKLIQTEYMFARNAEIHEYVRSRIAKYSYGKEVMPREAQHQRGGRTANNQRSRQKAVS